MEVPSVFPASERAEADQAIDRSLEVLRRDESVVEALVAVGAFSHATLHAGIAAHHASFAHAGVFASPAIEHALGRAALRVQSSASVERPAPRPDPRRVLHVATEIHFPEGGHGRLLERWIRSDATREHSLVMTPPGHDVPSVLGTAVAASGGTIHALAPGTSSFVERARHLRTLAAGADVVVLHTHPADALPLLALSWPGRPPTITCNHAPHVFWLGRSISDVVTCGRELAKTICTQRRGIPPEACLLLPLPVDQQREAVTRGRAAIRRELEVAPRELLLLTIASEYKLRAAGGRDLVETIASVAGRRKRVAWRIVGPAAQGRWAELAKQTAGRVRALGVRADLANLYAAADVFVDSYPFTSRTAMVDAAAARLPLVAPRWHPPEAEILSAWGSSVDSAISPFHDEASLDRLLDALVRDGPRRTLGEAAERAVADSLAGPRFAVMLQGVYQLAAARRELCNADGIAPHVPTPHVPIDDLDRYLQRLYSVTGVHRVLVNWHREQTNRGAAEAFPADEAWLADTHGLASVVGEQDLIIRDFEALVAQLRGALAAAEEELRTLR